MDLLNEARAAAEVAEELEHETIAEETTQQTSGFNFPVFDFSFLKTETGSGTIEDYNEHVLNPEHSRGISQILRGVTGFAGSLNLAILDIIFGAFEVLKENKKEVKKDNNINAFDTKQ